VIFVHILITLITLKIEAMYIGLAAFCMPLLMVIDLAVYFYHYTSSLYTGNRQGLPKLFKVTRPSGV
jgi:hypothetical protein